MQWKIPKNTKEFLWTQHVINKMRQYGLSEQKVRSVVFRHTRKEEGIAPRTIAVMQRAGSKKKPTELWVMFQTVKNQEARIKNQGMFLPLKKKIISAWKYPGISPKRNPIPENILREITSLT